MTLALLLTAATGAWASGDTKYTVTFKANGNTKTVENVTLPHTFELDPIIRELYPSLSGGHGSPAGTSASGNTNVTAYYNSNKHYATISASFEGAVTVTGQFFKDFNNTQYTLEINCMENLVAISDDKTEATIKMPTFDVDVNYELVRDMSVQMQAQVGDDATKEPRYRVQWNEEKDTFEPAELNPQQVLALFSVNDLIEEQALTQGTDYTVSIYAVDAEGQPTGNAMTFQSFTFAPGRYCVTASALLDAPYDGTTAPSNIFELFQGYEVEVPAGEYITYFKDEALYVEDENAKLYTITAVSGTAATTDELTIAPANTPILVKNNGSETKTILLIPTTEETDASINVYDGFKGTLEAKTTTNTDTYGPWNMAEGKKYYAFNGLQFVWVKDALDIAANKAWLEVTATASAAPQIRLVFNSATGIERVDREQSTVDGWYDLNGRRLPGKPTKKGVYIVNGKKMVVK